VIDLRDLTGNNDMGVADAPNSWLHCPHGVAMHALKDLFTSDVGLMSLAGIVFMLGMAVFFVRYFLKHMKEDEAREAAASRTR
jgi:hypothetical protein